jgi:hypothetical protein
MKVLFLDFDGVLHPAGVPPGTCMPFEWLPTLVEMLESAPDVRLSVHSSWREVHTQEHLGEFLGSLGNRVVGQVPSGPKSQAILSFLSKHQEIKDYLILDDSISDFVPELSGRLLVCKPLCGIIDPDVQLKLQAWLLA